MSTRQDNAAATDPALLVERASQWWSTSLIDIQPGRIALRGLPVEQLIGRVGFADMVWLLLRGELPTPAQARLLEAALVAAVDHGPHAPSIAISRMAVTCGLPINGAMASAINVLDDVHGGAGEQCMELMTAIAQHGVQGAALRPVVEQELERFAQARGKIIPGFGHRFHPVDPRSAPLLQLVDDAAARGEVPGRYGEIARTIEQVLTERKGKPIPMNIDAATAVIFCELGFAPALGRGIFILSRSVGILAHAWEQTQQGGRIKGPMPPAIPYRYTGPARHDLAQPPGREGGPAGA